MASGKVKIQDESMFSTQPFVREKQSFRPMKVASRIREELLMLVPDSIEDDRLDDVGTITITEVTCEPDLRNAMVKFAFAEDIAPGGAASRGETTGGDMAKVAEKILEGAARFLRRELSEKLGMKYTPLLCFRYDRGLLHAIRIDALLKEDQKRAKSSDSDDTGPTAGQ